MKFKELKNLIFSPFTIIKGKDIYPYVRKEYTCFDENEIIGVRSSKDPYVGYTVEPLLIVSLKDEEKE